MDIKIGQVDRDIMRQALYQARDGRLHILQHMTDTIGTPRADVSMHAPRIVTLKIRTDKIRDVIGPGGKVIRGIIEETGVKIDVEDDGTVLIASTDGTAMKRAVEIVEGITAEAVVGKIYKGTVRKIVDFGAFVEILPGTDGLLHISQIGPGRVQRVTDVLKEGDEVSVKVLEVDKSGKIRLSRKEAMQEQEGGEAAEKAAEQPPRSRRSN
jgi:polyribonucleotide nucleotidyltransferase